MTRLILILGKHLDLIFLVQYIPTVGFGNTLNFGKLLPGTISNPFEIYIYIYICYQFKILPITILLYEILFCSYNIWCSI